MCTHRHSNLAVLFHINADSRSPYWFLVAGTRPKFAMIWNPLQTPIMSLSSCAKAVISSWRLFLILFEIAFPAPVSSPYENPPGNAMIWKSSSFFVPSIKSLMWTISPVAPCVMKLLKSSSSEFIPYPAKTSTFGVAMIFGDC